MKEGTLDGWREKGGRTEGGKDGRADGRKEIKAAAEDQNGQVCHRFGFWYI